MNTTTHTFQVHIERSGNAEPIDGGTVTFLGEDYDAFTEAEALKRLLPGGGGPEELDLSLPGFVRWRGTLMPASEFQRLDLTLVVQGKPGEPSE